MPSYTDEQKRRAIEAVEECGGSVTRAMRRLGYPQGKPSTDDQAGMTHHTNGKPDGLGVAAALKEQTDSSVRSGMADTDTPSMLGVSSSAMIRNWARAAENPKPATADGSSINPMRDSATRAYDGFEESLEDRIRQLELENDVLRGAAMVLKPRAPAL